MPPNDETGSHSAVLAAIHALGARVADELGAVRSQLATIAPLVAEHSIHREAQADAVKDHETRIRAVEVVIAKAPTADGVGLLDTRVRRLEDWRWLVVGVAIGASLVGGGTGALIVKAMASH